MNINFKSHFPWPGADGQPEPTNFASQILNGMLSTDPDKPKKLHTIRRIKAKPGYREGMKLVLQGGSRFKPVPFAETVCTGVQVLRLQPSAGKALGVLRLERIDLVGARAVQQVELTLKLEQARVLELPIEGEAPPQSVLDGGGAAQQAVHASPRPTATRYLAGHRHLLVATLEEGLHQRPAGAGPDEFVAGLLPQQEADRLREQALAGAGLARDDVETRRELQPGRGDERGRRCSVQRASRRSKSFSSTFW